MSPSGKRLHNHGTSPFFLLGKLTTSMDMFNSYVKLPEGIICILRSYQPEMSEGIMIIKVYDEIKFQLTLPSLQDDRHDLPRVETAVKNRPA